MNPHCIECKKPIKDDGEVICDACDARIAAEQAAASTPRNSPKASYDCLIELAGIFESDNYPEWAGNMRWAADILLKAAAPAPSSLVRDGEAAPSLDGLPEGEYHLSDLENRLYKPFGDTGLPLDDASLLDHVCQYARRLERKAAATSPFLGEGAAQAQSNGAALIAAERQEQIHKHGWDVRHDADYGRGELVQAAATCLSLYVKGDMASINVAGEYEEDKMWPWQSDFGMFFFKKIDNKSDVDKLKVAGALIAAEIDRLQAPAAPATAPSEKAAEPEQVQIGFDFVECPECGERAVIPANWSDRMCPVCAGDKGEDVKMNRRPALSTDKVPVEVDHRPAPSTHD